VTLTVQRPTALVPALIIAFVSLWASDALAQRPALTRDVDNPALAPVRLWININMAANEPSKIVDSITVPAGKRLVIENASVWAFTSNSADSITGLWLAPKNVTMFHLLDPTPAEVKPIGGGAAVAAYNRVLKGYFEEGETLEVWAFATGTGGQRIVNIYLQGYFVKP
jgi:hypothetical protein